MAARHTIHYELSSAGDLRRLTDELHGVDAATIIVGFSGSGSWVPTDLQIARLVAAAKDSGKSLIAEGRTPKIAERAIMLGFRDSAILTDEPTINQQETTAIRSASEDPTRVINAADRFKSTANLATYRPADREVTFTWHGNRQHSELAADGGPARAPQRINWKPAPAGSLVSAPDLSGRKPKPVSAAEETAVNPAVHPGVRAPVPHLRESPVPDSSSDQGHQTAERPRRRMGFITVAVAALALLLVLGGGVYAAAYYLPAAEVVIVPHEEAVSSSLTYGLASDSVSLDIVIDPSSFSTETTAEATVDSTGERFEAAGTAEGIIQITNPLATEVTIPAGTEIPGGNGVIYYTAQDVRIPAADPFASLAFGSNTVGIYAGILGPDGNLSAGALTGQLANNMYYTNPEGIGGGRMDSFAVISEDDIEAVRQRVIDELQERAEQDFLDQIPAGMELVADSIEIGQPDIEVDGEPGHDGSQVSASGVISVRGLVYDPDELHEIASQETDRLLARQGQSDRILLAETVSIDEPTRLDGDLPAYQIDVRARARIVIPESEREAIQNALTGLNREDAEAYLASHPKIERFEIELERSWILDRMPEITSRIDVRVSSGERTASTR